VPAGEAKGGNRPGPGRACNQFLASLNSQKTSPANPCRREFDVFLQIHAAQIDMHGRQQRRLDMGEGCKDFKVFKSTRPLRYCAIAALIGAFPVPLAFGQGGQTEVSKTTPSNPQAPAPAPARPAVAPAAPAAPAAKPVSPIGAGAAWQTNLTQPPKPVEAPAAAAAPAAPQEDETAVVGKVNEYFNKMSDLQGKFVQTDPDGRQKHGRFYFQRPGKARFDYSAPSSLKIISDGRNLAIEDRDMNTSERYPLDVTPFKLLLNDNVDLAKDAKITAVEQGADVAVLSVEDKTGETSGRIRLFFNKADMSLKEWIITDAQGLDTRIEVSDLETNKKVAENLFIISPLGWDRDR
jgi:outer membrane lipoprotein-sorting protein